MRKGYAAHQASRQRLGITSERVLLVPTTQGDMTIAYIEAYDPPTLFTRMAASRDPFDVWFAERIKALYGMDIGNPPVTAAHANPANDSVFEWHAT